MSHLLSHHSTTPSQPLPVYGAHLDTPSAHNTVRSAEPSLGSSNGLSFPSRGTGLRGPPVPVRNYSAKGYEEGLEVVSNLEYYRSGPGASAGARKEQGGLKQMQLVEHYRAPSPWEQTGLVAGRESAEGQGGGIGLGIGGAGGNGINSSDAEAQEAQLDQMNMRLKRHIRVLRLISRILAFIVSILVFVPITMTLIKFLRTVDIRRVVPGDALTGTNTTSRGPWARESTTWPTYMYFGVATISLGLNLFIMLSYLRSRDLKHGNLKAANTGAYVATTFSWIVMVGQAVFWIVAATLYRTEKKRDDLWGWTCGAPAQGIQRFFEEDIDFEQFCNVQSFSWYAGVVQALLAVLTVVVFVLVLKRRKAQKVLKGREREVDREGLLGKQ